MYFFDGVLGPLVVGCGVLVIEVVGEVVWSELSVIEMRLLYLDEFFDIHELKILIIYSTLLRIRSISKVEVFRTPPHLNSSSPVFSPLPILSQH